MSRRPRILSDHDREAWTSYTRHVAPIRGSAPAVVMPPETAPAPPVRVRPGPAREPEPVVPELALGARGLGLDDESWRALSNGRLAPARRLDLHGRTANAAFAELHAFLIRSSAERLRCVEVITGRGSGEAGGVLRRELPHWLNRADLRPLIIAATHSQPGNPGAVRILLRRKR